MRNLKGGVATTATIIAIVSFWATIGGDAQSFLLDQFYLYDVPYSNQDEPYWCGPASMSMVLGYWGTNISQGDIAAEIYDPRSRITRMTDMVSYPMTVGFKSQDFTGSIYDLKTWIDNGVPVVVLQRFSLEDPYGHYRVVVGYDESSAMMFTFDPKMGINFTSSYTEFAQLWQPGSTFWTTNWTLAITPENDVFINLMKQYQIHMNLERSDYDEMTKEIERLRTELRQTQDEATFYSYLFAAITIILIVIIILIGVYVATRKPYTNTPKIDIQADGEPSHQYFDCVSENARASRISAQRS